MKKACSQIFTAATTLFVLMLLMPFAVAAQDASKAGDGSQKATPTTADAWRTALPEKEQVAQALDDAANVAGKGSEETPDQIEKRLSFLEHRWMDALKSQDAAMLKRILADEFTLTSAALTGTGQDKTQYIENSLRDSQLKSYNFDKLKVRVYGDTALVNAVCRQEAIVAGKESVGNFLLTDVWVRQEGRWHVVSRHTSQVTNAR